MSAFDSWSGHWFVLGIVVLSLEMLAFAFVTPILRTKRNVWLNEEDAGRFSGVVKDVEHRDVARIVRVHRNQVENFVPFLALGMLWVTLGIAGRVAPWLFAVFVVARTLHGVFYLGRHGRLRTASHTVSFLVLVVLALGAALHVVT